MADNDTLKCFFCGVAVDDGVAEIDPYIVEGQIGGMWAYHDRCDKMNSAWSLLDGSHRFWCHVEDCDEAPVYPFRVAYE